MSLPGDRGHVLIAANSGRDLAAAARRSGYLPLVADLFGDLDTVGMAAASIRIRESRLVQPPILLALESLAKGRAPVGCVYGSGFEDRPRLLDAIAQQVTLLGNTGAAVDRTKDPFVFAGLCAGHGVPHPEVSRDAASGPGWLLKKQGGVGGGHIRQARAGTRPRPPDYLQRRAAGTPVSALFLADGRRCLLLGFSEQWTDPAPRHRFRYGGAVRPTMPPPPFAAAMADGVARLAAALGLVGLNSADFLLRDDGFTLLEINPRPGATLDVFRDRTGALFHLHIEACTGALPDAAPCFPGAAAAAVVYAPRRLALPAGFEWPDWTADRQASRSPVAFGAPLCTVLAEADAASEARSLVARRRAEILALAGAAA